MVGSSPSACEDAYDVKILSQIKDGQTPAKLRRSQKTNTN